ncbi:MAG: LamG-like jellyroll fold domain-containing protein [Gammaproteobacteria bacterium]|nr:LamG-like jellyroll fold domain-containing protein [Gammaproteobacteria bacterium]
MTQENLIVSRKMDIRRIHKSLQWIGIILVMIVMTACGGGSGGGSSEEGATPTTISNTPTAPTVPTPPTVPPPPAPTMPPVNDQQLFADTVYPIMTANSCVQCHSDPTPLGLVPVLPYMAHATLETAYNEVINNQKVSFTNPANSRLVDKPRATNHNCGGPVACEEFAVAMEAAITSWAADRAAANPPSNNLPRVASAMASFADGQDGGAARIDANVIAMYDFSEGAGDIVGDSSGVGTPMDLLIEGDMQWVEEGGLRNVNGKAKAAMADSAKMFNLISEDQDEFTIEAWIIPDAEDQNVGGISVIAGYQRNNASIGNNNFIFGQVNTNFELRTRSETTGNNGQPALTANGSVVRTDLMHVVFTVDGTSGRKVFVDGQFVGDMDGAPLGQLNWDSDFGFALGNEYEDQSGNLWLGTYKMVAIHNRALTDVQVQQNYDAGLGNFVTLAFDVSDIIGAPATVQMQATNMDDNAYLFASPTLVTDVTGVQVRNIRVAVNNNLPVATQSFRSVDMMVNQSGQVLSPLGAVIPKDQGPNLDMFHLEFEVLAGQTGTGDLFVDSLEPGIPNYGVLPDFGVRSFSSVNDTMSALTTIPITQNTVRNRYEELRDSLPATADILAFNSASQIAIQRLAVTYCDRVRRSNAACNTVFGTSCNNIANATDKQNRVNALFDRFVGDLDNQPDRAETTAEVNRLMDDLGCANGCTNATKDIALQASCAAVLSSGVMTIN